MRRQDDFRIVARNLAAAARDGLPITYEPCDVVDPQQVAALFTRIPPPSIVIHNAGIDEPKRLSAKSPDEVVRVVEVKVTGFANLLDAVLATPERRAVLRMWSNVGSMAGRLGG
jgi:NAD(P)-dependent dehydrogenase (short-subunit alcohol dehydrogenase family)